MNANEFFDLVVTELDKRGIPSDFAEAKLNQIKGRISKLDEADAEKFYSEGNYRAVIDKICNSYESEIKSKDTIALTQTVEEVQAPEENEGNSDKDDEAPKKVTVVNPTKMPKSSKKVNVITSENCFSSMRTGAVLR